MCTERILFAESSLLLMFEFFTHSVEKPDPPAKRMKLSNEGGEGGEGEDDEEEEMEAGGLDIPTGGQMMVQVKPAQTEVMETEKKAAMMRSGKTVEERQEEFKEMLLERGVSLLHHYSYSYHHHLNFPRCQHFQLGTKNFPNLCLIHAICCSIPRREKTVLKNSFDHEPKRREKKNAVN